MAIKRHEKKFIVYSHLNTETGETFYIGIGKKGREIQSYKRSNMWVAYVSKHGFIPTILFSSLTWDEACEKEKDLIKKIGRKDKGEGPLVNLTDGGEGAIGQIGYWKGKKRPDLSERNKGNKYSCGRDGTLTMTPEVIEKIKKGRLGKPPWNKGLPGKKWTEEEKIKWSESRKGKKHSEATKQKMALAHTGKKKSPEHLLSMSLCRIGKPLSEQAKINMSKAQTERWKKIKGQIAAF